MNLTMTEHNISTISHDPTTTAISTISIAIHDLHAYYGESHILHGVNLRVREGELVTLLGRNGSGRSTTLKAIMNMVGKRQGSIKINGHELTNKPSHKIAHMGIGYCPEERGIFSSLSVEENLLLPPIISDKGMSLSDIYDMFPNLYERRDSRGTNLSGGEQQMLAMARILRAGASVLLLDEITEGLAPVIVENLSKLLTTLKNKGLTILLVEQNFYFASKLADRHYIMEEGRIVAEIMASELKQKMPLINQYLSV